MSENEIDFNLVLQYQNIFGKPKYLMLWEDFCQQTDNLFATLSYNNREDLRLKFHSLRSSSKVFGLTYLSYHAEIIENLIINDENIEKIKKTVDICEKIFHNTQKELNRFFEC